MAAIAKNESTTIKLSKNEEISILFIDGSYEVMTINSISVFNCTTVGTYKRYGNMIKKVISMIEIHEENKIRREKEDMRLFGKVISR